MVNLSALQLDMQYQVPNQEKGSYCLPQICTYPNLAAILDFSSACWLSCIRSHLFLQNTVFIWEPAIHLEYPDGVNVGISLNTIRISDKLCLGICYFGIRLNSHANLWASTCSCYSLSCMQHSLRLVVMRPAWLLLYQNQQFFLLSKNFVSL